MCEEKRSIKKVRGGARLVPHKFPVLRVFVTQRKQTMTSVDNFFRPPSEKSMQLVKQAHPWISDHKYFQTCKINAAAAMKMLQHAVEGVEKGLKRGGSSGGYGAPIEIMGLMAGRPVTPEDYQQFASQNADGEKK